MKKILIIIILLLCLTANIGQAQFNDSEPMFGEQLNLGHFSTDGLVGFWRFIEAGNLVDESLSGNDGTITGATWVGGGLSFNGSTQYVDLLPSTDFGNLPANDFTIITRVKLVGSQQWGTLFSLWDNTGLLLRAKQTDQALQLSINLSIASASYLTSNDTLVRDIWHTITIVWNTTTKEAVFYIDGIEPSMSTQTQGSGTYTQTGFGLIGRLRDDIASQDFNGLMSDMIIYNRALSASEIQALYINPNLPMQQEPIWLFFSPDVGSLQWIIDGGHIGPSPLKGSVVR